MTNREMFFHSPGATSTRAAMFRRASASCTSSIERTDWIKFSSNSSTVRTVPLDGWMAAKLLASPSDKIVRALRMIPIANRPTAIDSTISNVRVLLPNRSWMTLYQRGLSMCASAFCADHFSICEGNDPRPAFRDILIVCDQKDRMPLIDQIREQIDNC